jgi:hypothetical protein
MLLLFVGALMLLLSVGALMLYVARLVLGGLSGHVGAARDALASTSNSPATSVLGALRNLVTGLRGVGRAFIPPVSPDVAEDTTVGLPGEGLRVFRIAGFDVSETCSMAIP